MKRLQGATKSGSIACQAAFPQEHWRILQLRTEGGSTRFTEAVAGIRPMGFGSTPEIAAEIAYRPRSSAFSSWARIPLQKGHNCSVGAIPAERWRVGGRGGSPTRNCRNRVAGRYEPPALWSAFGPSPPPDLADLGQVGLRRLSPLLSTPSSCR